MAERHYRLRTGTLGGLACVLLLAACAAPPARRVPQDEGRPPKVPTAPTVAPAAASLLSQGRAERAAGAYAQAGLTLERALRIAPGEPAVWLELARLRLDEGDAGQAEQLARKACSLAVERPAVAAECARLIAEATRSADNGDRP